MNTTYPLKTIDIPRFEEECFENLIKIVNRVKSLNRIRSLQYVTITDLLVLYPFVTRSRVYEMINYQGLKHIKGKPILICPKDFEEFLESQKQVETKTIDQEYNQKYSLISIPTEKAKYV